MVRFKWLTGDVNFLDYGGNGRINQRHQRQPRWKGYGDEMNVDEFQLSVMRKTAEAFMKLAAVRGVSCCVEVSEDGKYFANGHDCGSSVHGLYDWLDNQPGVRP